MTKVNDLNLCTFTGRLVKDSEMKYSQNGKSYLRFSIAVNKKFNDKEDVDYPNFTILKEKYAQAMEQYLKKGMSVTEP